MRESAGLACLGLFQAKNEFLLLQNYFHGFTLSCQRDLQAFVSESGKMPQAGLNQNSVCVSVCRILPGGVPGCGPGGRLAQSPGTRPFPGHQASPFRLHLQGWPLTPRPLAHLPSVGGTER